jgi:hypothetical protein
LLERLWPARDTRCGFTGVIMADGICYIPNSNSSRFRCAVSMAAALLLGLASAITTAQTKPATLPAGQDTQSLVQAVVRHPRDRDRWEPLKDPARRDAAKKMLVSAFRDPANASKEQRTFIKPEGGRDEILEAIAGIFGGDSADVLLEAAKDRDVEVRGTAIGLMGWQLNAPNPKISRAVRDALRDGDSSVVISALQTIRSRPDPEAGAAVLELLRHPPTVKREKWDPPTTYNAGDFSGYTVRDGFDEALAAIGATSYPGALDELAKLAHDPSAYVRSRAAEAIAPCAASADLAKRADAVTLLKAMLADPNNAVCGSAAVALAALNDPSGTPVLVFNLRDATRLPDGDESINRRDALPLVKALEELTGEDFQSSLGEEFWWMDRGPGDPAQKLQAVQPRIKHILERVGAHGLPMDGYPSLPGKLADADKAMFDRAFANWLVDPRGGTWVSFDFEERTAWAAKENVNLSAWLFPAQGDQPARLLLEDKASLAIPPNPKHEDLIGDTRRDLDAFRAGKNIYPSAVKAAWLYRLGREDLAAQIFFVSRGCGDRADFNLDHPDAGGAWRNFSWAVHAYMVRADDEAMDDIQRLARLYPDYVDAYGPGTELLAELTRRQQEGTLNRQPDDLPKDFDQWPAKKKVTRLIRDLEEVDARQGGQPGGVDLSGDPRVLKLIDIGEPAVPALIDCIESDKRLTRSVHFWRDFAQNRGIIAVREAALTAVMSILRTSVFEPSATGDDFTSRGEDEAKATAQRLRKYWDVYSTMPYDQRMMKILTNPGSRPEAALEAAANLAHLGDKRRIGTMVWTGGVDQEREGANPVIGRYKNPTVAEATLAAWDRHVKLIDSSKDDSYQRRQIDSSYADDLIALGDVAIAPELKRRFDLEKELDRQGTFAFVCFWLKEEGPMRQLAAGFQAGTLPLPANDRDTTAEDEQPGNRRLSSLIHIFTDAKTAYCDDALFALSAPNHPYHAVALSYVQFLLRNLTADRESSFFKHPFFIRLIRPLLDHIDSDACNYTLNGDMFNWSGPRSGASLLPSDAIASSVKADRVQTATGWQCDLAAIELSEALPGAPAYHPLLKDREHRLADLKAFVDRYGAQLRPMTGPENAATLWWMSRSERTLLIPEFRSTGKAATAADVAAGRAIFDLGGHGKAASLHLPATARFKIDHGNKDAPRILIVQAETDAEGKLHYGIVARHVIRAAVDDELDDILPVPEE